MTSSEASSLALLGKARFAQNDVSGAIEAYRRSILTFPKEAAQGRVNAFFESIVVWQTQRRDTTSMRYFFEDLRSAYPADPYLSSAHINGRIA